MRKSKLTVGELRDALNDADDDTKVYLRSLGEIDAASEVASGTLSAVDGEEKSVVMIFGEGKV